MSVTLAEFFNRKGNVFRAKGTRPAPITTTATWQYSKFVVLLEHKSRTKFTRITLYIDGKQLKRVSLEDTTLPDADREFKQLKSILRGIH